MVNIKRAIFLSIFAYAISFTSVAVVAMLLGVDLSTAEEIPTSVWVAGIFITIIIAAVFTHWYFKGVHLRPSAQEGLRFAFVLLLVSFAMDLVMIIPAILTTDAAASILAYYADPFFWIGVLAMFATCMYVGNDLKKKSRSSLRTISSSKMPARKRKTAVSSRRKSKSKKKKKKKKK